MKRINVVGIGPGSREHMTPAAMQALAGSDIIIGGRRNLESLDTAGKETVMIGSDLDHIIDIIRKNRETRVISVIVSGDPGFYSMLGFLQKHFRSEDLNVIPGISSVQYLFARIGMTWEDASLRSLHGREDHAAAIVRKNRKSAFLTDRKKGFREIARELCRAGLDHCVIYAGSQLSYPEEKIISGIAAEMAENEENMELCVVAVINEKSM